MKLGSVHILASGVIHGPLVFTNELLVVLRGNKNSCCIVRRGGIWHPKYKRVQRQVPCSRMETPAHCGETRMSKTTKGGKKTRSARGNAQKKPKLLVVQSLLRVLGTTNENRENYGAYNSPHDIVDD